MAICNTIPYARVLIVRGPLCRALLIDSGVFFPWWSTLRQGDSMQGKMPCSKSPPASSEWTISDVCSSPRQWPSTSNLSMARTSIQNRLKSLASNWIARYAWLCRKRKLFVKSACQCEKRCGQWVANAPFWWGTTHFSICPF